MLTELVEHTWLTASPTLGRRNSRLLLKEIELKALELGQKPIHRLIARQSVRLDKDVELRLLVLQDRIGMRENRRQMLITPHQPPPPRAPPVEERPRPRIKRHRH